MPGAAPDAPLASPPFSVSVTPDLILIATVPPAGTLSAAFPASPVKERLSLTS